MFEATGVYHGRAVAVAWDAGKLTGDPIATVAVRSMAVALDGLPVGPHGGPYTRRDHLADPLSAYFVILRTFDRLDGITGDGPEVPDVPRGAVC